MTAVTIQSKKILSSEVKDNEALLEPSYGKDKKNFLANLIHITEIRTPSDKQNRNEHIEMLGKCIRDKIIIGLSLEIKINGRTRHGGHMNRATKQPGIFRKHLSTA